MQIRHRILPVNLAGKISRGFRGSEFRAEFCSSKFLVKIPLRNFVVWNFELKFYQASLREILDKILSVKFCGEN